MPKMSPIFHNYNPYKEGELISQKITCRGGKRMAKLEDCVTLVLHGHLQVDL